MDIYTQTPLHVCTLKALYLLPWEKKYLLKISKMKTWDILQ